MSTPLIQKDSQPRKEGAATQQIAEEAFHALEDESVDCKVYGHKERALSIIFSAIERAMEFHSLRWTALQRAQHNMRDPERKMVCDILANGSTFAQPQPTKACKEQAPRAQGSPASCSVCACGHSVIDHQRFSDHDECTIADCGCDQVRPQRSEHETLTGMILDKMPPRGQQQEEWTTRLDHNEPDFGWIVCGAQKISHRMSLFDINGIIAAHNAELTAERKISNGRLRAYERANETLERVESESLEELATEREETEAWKRNGANAVAGLERELAAERQKTHELQYEINRLNSR